MQLRRRHDVLQRLEPLTRDALRQVDAVAQQTIEIERAHRQFLLQARDIELAAESPHRDLEGVRSTARRERDRLAVEHELLRAHRARRVGDLRNRRGHVVEASREDAHVVALLVDLDPRAVHLPLERDVAREVRQRFVDVGRHLREHRLDGRHHSEPIALQSCGARSRGPRAR